MCVVWFALALRGAGTAAAVSSMAVLCVVTLLRFVVIDMSVDGSGEWMKWNDSSFFGAPFIWTTLHDFGGTDGMKGR